jgi:hypothetical protein
MWRGNPFRPTSSSRISCPYACRERKKGSRGTAPAILNISSTARWVDGFTPRLFHSSGKGRRYLLNWRIGALQGLVVLGKGKISYFCRESNKDISFISLIPCLFLQSKYFPTNALRNTTHLIHNKNILALKCHSQGGYCNKGVGA